MVTTNVNSQSKRNENIKKAVTKVLTDQSEAWNKCDLEGFMQGYWNSEELSFTSGNKNTRGWQTTFDNYKNGYDSCEKMGKLSFSELDITVFTTRYVMVRGRFLLERENDKPTGLFTLIVKKFKDGWKVIHDHTST